MSYVLVGVPVKARFFEDEPVLPPFLGEIAFSVLLLPQPALAVAVAQILTGDSPSTGTGEGTWVRRQKKPQTCQPQKWFCNFCNPLLYLEHITPETVTNGDWPKKKKNKRKSLITGSQIKDKMGARIHAIFCVSYV